jgi:hypothetical protein
LVRYFRGEIQEGDLLDAAIGVEQAATFRCFLAMDLEWKGKLDAALAHYRWVRDHGDPGSPAHRLAWGGVGRLEAKAKETGKK